MPTPCAFCVIGMDRSSFERCQGVLDKAGLVQRVGVNRDLNIVVIRHRQTTIDRGRRRAPILMHFEPHGTGANLLH